MPTSATTRSDATPKITILGATGPTERHIVTQALSRGYDVTAFVRSPEKVADLKGVKLVVGDVRDEEALREAIEGRDAVISAIGTPASPFQEVTLLSSPTKALVDAMKAEQVSRLVAVTGIGAGDSRGRGGFVFDKLIFPLLLRNVYADKDRQEAIIRESGLEWTIVRPSVLNNKGARGTVRALTDLSDFNGGSISRQDVARFLLDQVGSDERLRKSPRITPAEVLTAANRKAVALAVRRHAKAAIASFEDREESFGEELRQHFRKGGRTSSVVQEGLRHQAGVLQRECDVLFGKERAVLASLRPTSSEFRLARARKVLDDLTSGRLVGRSRRCLIVMSYRMACRLTTTKPMSSMR